jgi:RND family efflux transporter MFP subunit
VKRLWIAFAVLVTGGLVAGAGYLGFASNRPQAARAPTAPVTVPVTRCDVEHTVTAPGSVVNTRTIRLEMPFAGQLAEVTVRAGDAVTEGQILARLAGEENYAMNVAAAELELAQARQALDDLQSEAPLRAAEAKLDLVTHQAAVEEAQKRLDNLMSVNTGYYADAVATAQRNYDIAAANLELVNIGSRSEQQAVETAQAQVDDLYRQLQNVIAWYGPDHEQTQAANRDYQRALEDLEVAHIQYGTALASRQASLDTAQQTLDSAQANYNAATHYQPPSDDLALAAAQLDLQQAQLAEAQHTWESLQTGPDALELSAAQAGIDQATAALAAARRTLEQLEIKAPFAGVILEADARPGETLAAASVLFSLADPQAVEVETTVIEEDVPLITTGLAAEVYFDALPGELVTGTITAIVPQRLPGDRPLYHVNLSLSRVPAALFEGMSADASIIIAVRRGVLCLPRALAQASADGTARVDLWLGSATQERTIAVGLRGDTYVEVLSGVREGDAVVAR